MDENKYKGAIKNRMSTVRIRTWSLTLAIIIALALYLIVTTTFNNNVNWIDFIVMCTVQIVTYYIYFPDGELYGQKDKSFEQNRNAYNLKATDITEQRKIGLLREYCKYDFEQRKNRYIRNECAFIGITTEELRILQNEPLERLRKLKHYEFKDDNGSHLVFFSKPKRKALIRLLTKKIPVSENHPETIMSAVQNDGGEAIQDQSQTFRSHAYVRKLFFALVVGGFFAYIGFSRKDEIGLSEIVAIVVYLTSVFTNAVMAFSSGETCTKVHKNQFYIELINFIDSFNEWEQSQR